MTYLEGPLKAYRESLTLGGTALQPGGLYTEPLSQGYENGRGYILVVPDEAAEGLSVHHQAYAAKTAEPVSYEDYYNLTVVMDKIWEGTGFGDQINTRTQVEEAVASLNQAKAMHDELEAIYNPHVDFSLVDQTAQDIWGEIQTF